MKHILQFICIKLPEPFCQVSFAANNQHQTNIWLLYHLNLQWSRYVNCRLRGWVFLNEKEQYASMMLGGLHVAKQPSESNSKYTELEYILEQTEYTHGLIPRITLHTAIDINTWRYGGKLFSTRETCNLRQILVSIHSQNARGGCSHTTNKQNSRHRQLSMQLIGLQGIVCNHCIVMDMLITY